MNIEPNLFPFTQESFPANTWGTICPGYQVRGNYTWCHFRARVCSDLLTAELMRVMLLWKQQQGVLPSSTALSMAASPQVMRQKSGRIHIFPSIYTRESCKDILFFTLLLAVIFFTFSTLLSSLISSSVLVNKTTFLSQSSQFSNLITGFKILLVSAWITRQKTSRIS